MVGRTLVWRILAAVLLGAGVCAVAWLATDLLVGTALVERAATCVPGHCFCEHAGEFPGQLANSVSSFAFVFFGVWVLLSRRNPASGTREHRLAPLLGITMLFIGVSSFFYHATLSFFGQFLDIFSMFTFGLLLFFGALYRAGRLRGGYALAGFVAASVVFGLLQFAYPDARRILFAVLLVPGIILELTPFITGHNPRSRRVWAIYAGLAVMVVAYGIWLLDQSPVFCERGSLLQGHAIWHTLGAVAAFLVFIHYRLTPHHVSMQP
ncbi:MAG: ceramidase domain-containing protein [Microbacteriaceae bacterium]|nr:ceramidase domain-containing protein [Microbacteriaceae bacterium]